jgi:hypothetical protein
MYKKKTVILGIVLLIGLMLTGCAGYYSGYGYYESPYYQYDYGYYPYPHHRWFGVSPGWSEHHRSGEHHEGGEHHLH